MGEGPVASLGEEQFRHGVAYCRWIWKSDDWISLTHSPLFRTLIARANEGVQFAPAKKNGLTLTVKIEPLTIKLSQSVAAKIHGRL